MFLGLRWWLAWYRLPSPAWPDAAADSCMLVYLCLVPGPSTCCLVSESAVLATEARVKCRVCSPPLDTASA